MRCVAPQKTRINEDADAMPQLSRGVAKPDSVELVETHYHFEPIKTTYLSGFVIDGASDDGTSLYTEQTLEQW